MNLPATLTVCDDEGETLTTFPGTILNLSEGGVRCFVGPDLPGAGNRVIFTFAGKNGPLEFSGVVVRHVPAGHKGSGLALAIRFDDPDLHGDAIRRLVFAEQLRVRQSQLVTRSTDDGQDDNPLAKYTIMVTDRNPNR